MSTEQGKLTVQGLGIEVVRKDIKNLHLGVYPPNGRVRVAAPLRISDAAVRLAVVAKLGWIKRQREKFGAQPRESKREMVSGESHYFLGRRYRLRVVKGPGPSAVRRLGRAFIEMHVADGATREERERVLHRWYRQRLRELARPMIEKWQVSLGVEVRSWGIKRMKTKWGTCHEDAGRFWINLELVKKPVHCLEYIIVHELTHLLERHHNDRFVAIMNRHLPQWRLYRDELNAEPLAHETWTY